MELVKQAASCSKNVSWMFRERSQPHWDPTNRGRIPPIPMPRLKKSKTFLTFLPESEETLSLNNTELWRLVLLEQLRLIKLQQHEIIFKQNDVLEIPYVSLYELDLLAEISRVLLERNNEIERHRQLLLHVAELKQKVRRQKTQINQIWHQLIQDEQKEIDFITAEKENIEGQIKNDQLAGSKDTLHKVSMPELSKEKGSKPPPASRMGNYAIMAKRLQGEIKHLEQNVNDMKSRLQTELERKASIESKVKEMRTSLALHRKQDTLTAPTTPIQ